MPRSSARPGASPSRERAPSRLAKGPSPRTKTGAAERRALAIAPEPSNPSARLAELRPEEIEGLRHALGQKSGELLPRWNANPEDVQKSVAQLVLALVEFLRQLLERQAIRRMEMETLDPQEIERIGLALMRLEETVHEMASRFGLAPEDLNLDLGPLGRLT